MVSKAAIDEIGNRANRQRRNLATEEATKQALVLPLLQTLGYDVFDPEQVVPEFTADYGLRNAEKVDYAILRDGNPVMLIECKKVGDPLDVARASQLARYFAMTPARIGILTDGIVYKFFSDLDAENMMDADPFLEIDITNMDQRDIQALGCFAKNTFDLDEARSTASNMKHIAGMKSYLAQMYSQPDEDFVRLLTRRVFSGPLVQSRMEYFTGVTKLAFHEFVNDLISDTLRRATDIVSSGSNPADEPEPSQQETEVNDLPQDDTKGIFTTVEELQGYELVKAIVSDVVDPDRVVIRDTKSYCGILLDDNNRKPICRLHFNVQNRKGLSIFGTGRDDMRRREETIHRIESVNDIDQFAEQLRDTVRMHMEEVN